MAHASGLNAIQYRSWTLVIGLGTSAPRQHDHNPRRHMRALVLRSLERDLLRDRRCLETEHEQIAQSKTSCAATCNGCSVSASQRISDPSRQARACNMPYPGTWWLFTPATAVSSAGHFDDVSFEAPLLCAKIRSA
jgi:hypothetical protein